MTQQQKKMKPGLSWAKTEHPSSKNKDLRPNKTKGGGDCHPPPQTHGKKCQHTIFSPQILGNHNAITCFPNQTICRTHFCLRSLCYNPICPKHQKHLPKPETFAQTNSTPNAFAIPHHLRRTNWSNRPDFQDKTWPCKPHMGQAETQLETFNSLHFSEPLNWDLLVSGGFRKGLTKLKSSNDIVLQAHLSPHSLDIQFKQKSCQVQTPPCMQTNHIGQFNQCNHD